MRVSSNKLRERGQILMLVALLLAAILGFVGLIVDAGFFYVERRSTQNGADEAARAAALELFYGNPAADAETAAFENAAANGFDNDGSSNTVTVNIPPTSGDYAGVPEHVEVVIERDPPTFFIHAILDDAGGVAARAVAGAHPFPEPYALITLDPDDCQSFDQQGQAGMDISGGGVMVNANCEPNAFNKTGSGTLTVDGEIDVHGGTSITGSGSVSPEPENVSWTVDDPLASLTPPQPGLPAPGSLGTPLIPKTFKHSAPVDIVLHPGTYYGGIYLDCVCTVTLLPGIYIMAGGGFTKEGGANVQGDEVMIYNTTNPTNESGDGEARGIRIAGSGTMALTPPTSGYYEGITFWQDEAIMDDFVLRGDNSSTQGLFYAPSAELNVEGGTSLGVVQLVVNTFHLAGNGDMTLTYGEFRTFEAPGVVIVE